MHETKKILVPMDFSEEAKIALHYAINLVGDDEEAEVLMIHVSEPSATENDALIMHALLEDTKVHFVHSGKVTCDYLIETGELTNAIIKAQSDKNSNLIVMGTKGAWTEEAVSNTSRLVAQTTCPVLVVPEITEFLDISRLVLAVDDNEIVDLFPLNTLLDIAKTKETQVHALTIDNGINQGLASQNRDHLERFFEPSKYVKSVLRNDNIEKGIAHYMKDNKIDLLTLFLRKNLYNGMASKGKLADILTKHAHVPLLIIS